MLGKKKITGNLILSSFCSLIDNSIGSLLMISVITDGEGRHEYVIGT